MFPEKSKEEIEDFMSYLDYFDEDRKKRIENIKKIDKLLGTNSFEESTEWKVEGKDEI